MVAVQKEWDREKEKCNIRNSFLLTEHMSPCTEKNLYKFQTLLLDIILFSTEHFSYYIKVTFSVTFISKYAKLKRNWQAYHDSAV